MGTFLRDPRLTFSGFRGSPGFALVAVATPALGIVAHTAISSTARSVLLDPLPYLRRAPRVDPATVLRTE